MNKGKIAVSHKGRHHFNRSWQREGRKMAVHNAHSHEGRHHFNSWRTTPHMERPTTDHILRKSCLAPLHCFQLMKYRPPTIYGVCLSHSNTKNTNLELHYIPNQRKHYEWRKEGKKLYTSCSSPRLPADGRTSSNLFQLPPSTEISSMTHTSRQPSAGTTHSIFSTSHCLICGRVVTITFQ